ncbi:hypothetical protein DESC_880022 [Desulfosarcina cetonica]|nr:hypothetical protein DESC_880022 [Desulfosarcina cetonica]
MRARGQAGLLVLLGAMPGENNDDIVGATLLDLGQHFRAVQIGKLQVEDNHREGCLCEALNGGTAIVADLAGQVAQPQPPGQHVGVALLVIND